jgi:hypothetical protein
MSKYETLVRLLDQIRLEGIAAGYVSYKGDAVDSLNQARAKAYIHLFLKVKFGLLGFKERESFMTDGADDGGVDGYYLDAEAKTISFLQSKFRTNEKNFEGKQIEMSEIVSMDIARITEGETTNENGARYNSKILALIRRIREIDDIGRYKYRVVIIANLRGVTPTNLRKLTGGFPAEVFDAERCYSELVFPVLSGTYFQKGDLSIYLDLSNKNAGAKINYEVSTIFGPCDITVLFVPTLEIAKVMYKYKNSILKYNPRSYLEFAGVAVNESIRGTIISSTTNEFALLNNGITMVSDETNINEKIGQKNRAQLLVTNPQIINGGQTAYMLSRIYENNIAQADETFKGKEVLLKVITLTKSEQNPRSPVDGIKLIERISTATNQQTAVTNSDRHSNDEGFQVLQRTVFERYGVLFERKRGEFADGVRDGYIKTEQVLDRNIFAKIYFMSTDQLSKASKRAFLKIVEPEKLATNFEALDRFYLGYRFYLELNRPSMTKTNNTATRVIASFVKTSWGTEVATSTMLEAAIGYLNERELQAKNVNLAKELRRTKKRKERARDKRGRPDVSATED